MEVSQDPFVDEFPNSRSRLAVWERVSSSLRTRLSPSSNDTNGNEPKRQLPKSEDRMIVNQTSDASLRKGTFGSLRQRATQWQRSPGKSPFVFDTDFRESSITGPAVRFPEVPPDSSNDSYRKAVLNEDDPSGAVKSWVQSIPKTTRLGRRHSFSSQLDGARASIYRTSSTASREAVLPFSVSEISSTVPDCAGELDTNSSRARSVQQARMSPRTILSKEIEEHDELRSTFSWTTVEEGDSSEISPISTPPSSLPSQSIDSTPRPKRMISRRRPVQRRMKKEDKPAALDDLDDSDSIQGSEGSLQCWVTTPEKTSESFKRHQRHLRILLLRENNNAYQQIELEKAIEEVDFFRKMHPSPLHVSFATIRAAERESKELHEQLHDVKLEAREIGIAIARARVRAERKYHGNAEALWVGRLVA